MSHDLKKGEFFTLTEWTVRKDHSWVGDCLEVLTVFNDFVRVKHHYTESFGLDFTLDMREVNYERLPAYFVNAVLN